MVVVVCYGGSGADCCCGYDGGAGVGDGAGGVGGGAMKYTHLCTHGRKHAHARTHTPSLFLSLVYLSTNATFLIFNTHLLMTST